MTVIRFEKKYLVSYHCCLGFPNAVFGKARISTIIIVTIFFGTLLKEHLLTCIRFRIEDERKGKQWHFYNCLFICCSQTILFLSYYLFWYFFCNKSNRLSHGDRLKKRSSSISKGHSWPLFYFASLSIPKKKYLVKIPT